MANATIKANRGRSDIAERVNGFVTAQDSPRAASVTVRTGRAICMQAAVVSVRRPRRFLAEACRIEIDPRDLCTGWGARCRAEVPCEAHRRIARALRVAYEEGQRAAAPDVSRRDPGTSVDPAALS